MSGNPDRMPPALTEALTERLRDVAGNAAILALIALLAVTAWIACIAGLVVLLAPLWGMAGALLAVGLFTAGSALAFLLWLQRRARRQRMRARLRQEAIRRQGQAALVAALPGLLRNRPGALVIGAGLALGAVIVAALQDDDKD